MNITWTITQMKGADLGAPLGVVVTDAQYRVEAASAGKFAFREGQVRLAKIKPLPDGGCTALGVDQESFLQYDTVTEQDVVRWVKEYLGQNEVNTLERTVEQELEAKLNAPVQVAPVVLTPPWATEG